MSTSLKLTHTDLPAAPRPDPDHADCRGVASVLSRVGDKWSVFVIMMLGDGPKRFNELKRMINGISQRMLTLTLRGLERDGLVTRTIFPTIPPRVDYELTDLGRGLSRPVEALGKWAMEHLEQIEAARTRFDGRNEP
ncbi:winged helix-turn-helix transcriptional regulator [Bradyrhizobium neotropicale]|uniref:Transcriptional regulator n=1 Tax=Bradyrhizobium neotropicale TaxID=1497615 RepID=A0A176YLQ3_9BRAD|nr:helix-turn-helix domain-containing protein [Bradyrhizobium neotropicale]OAF07524.1 transcriptional regulator [Bradyrhizobium neotropicale]